MVSLPTSPEGPTVYAIVSRQSDPALHALTEAGVAALGADACTMIDLPVGPTPSEADRLQVLEFLQDSYNARGAFVVEPARAFFDGRTDAFDAMDDACRLLGEVGAIVRRPGALQAAAPRLKAAMRAADRILPAEITEVLVFGAGADARALAAALGCGMCAARPAKVILARNHAAGLNLARQHLLNKVSASELEIRHIENPTENDRLLALLPPGSAIVRAPSANEQTAMLSGSASLYPTGAVIWDMLSPATASAFLGSAVRQREAAGLKLSDGSAYREERRVAMMETMFGAEAGDDDLAKLRAAVRNLDA